MVPAYLAVIGDPMSIADAAGSNVLVLASSTLPLPPLGDQCFPSEILNRHCSPIQKLKPKQIRNSS